MTSKYLKQSRYAKKVTSHHLKLLNFMTVAYLTDILSVANCANPDSVFNTGKPICDLKKKKMLGIIFADAGLEISGADIASVPSFISYVKDATVAPRGSRMYPLFDVNNFVDNTGDPATGAVGNLTTASIVTADAVPTFQFGYDGSEARHKRLAAMTGASLDIFFVDEQFAIYGTRGPNGGIKGYSVLQAYTDTSKFIIADAVNQYAFRITLSDIQQYRNQSEYVVLNNGILAATGLVNAELREVEIASNVVSLSVIAEGGTDLEPLHGAAIAGETFTARRLDTGVAIPVTAVADNPTDDTIDLTMDATAWGALPAGTQVQIVGPLAADLADAGVRPYEFISVVVEKPA